MPTTVRHLPRASVLDLDVELAAAVSPADRARADRACQARLLELSPGLWTPESLAVDTASVVGMLLVRGALVCTTGTRRRNGTEVLGPGDLACPWRFPGEAPAPPVDVRWTVLRPLTVAVLDEAFVGRAASVPSVMSALVHRQTRRARMQTAMLGVAHEARVEVRLLAVFWLLAERWGRMTSSGAVLPIRLSHQMLAGMVAAQRPTVSTAMGRLQRSGALDLHPEGVLLRRRPEPASSVEDEGSPPGEHDLGLPTARRSRRGDAVCP